MLCIFATGLMVHSKICILQFIRHNVIQKLQKKEGSFVIFVQFSCPSVSLNVECNTLYSRYNVSVHLL